MEFASLANRETSQNASPIASKESSGFRVLEDYFLIRLDCFGLSELIEPAALTKLQTIITSELIDGLVNVPYIQDLEPGRMDADESLSGIPHGFITHIRTRAFGLSGAGFFTCSCISCIECASALSHPDLAAREAIYVGHDVPGGGLVAFSEGFFEFGEGSGAGVADSEDYIGYIIELREF